MKNIKYKDLKNKYVLITGSNKGIGKEILTKFLKNGSIVISAVRKKDKKFIEFIKKKEKKYNKKILVLDFDLEDEKKMILSINKLKKKIGLLDVLVNNAGTSFGAIFEMTSIENLRNTFSINFFSQMRIIQLCLKLLKKSNYPSIINIGSISGINAERGFLAYGASKASLMYSSQVMAKEFKNYKIRVNSIAPSAVKTEMIKKMDKIALSELLKNTKMKAPLHVTTVANKVLYLASKKSSHINGKILRITKNDQK